MRAIKAGVARSAKRRVGGFAVMYSLFFGFARMFEGVPEYVEVSKDPERKKRPAAAAPPSEPSPKHDIKS